MARTRGASSAFDTQLDRQGNPISPSAAYLQRAPKLSGGTVLQGPGAEPASPLLPIVGYRADARSWARNMEAYDLCLLFDLWLRKQGHSFTVDVTMEEFATMAGDLRRHFMPVRGEPAQPADVPDERTDWNEADQIRAELMALGVDVDRRWGLITLRAKLEEATEPQRPGMRA